jgi:hypothetical protein
MIHDIDIVFNVFYKPLQGLLVSPSWACGGTGGARDGAEPHSGDYELYSAGNNDLCTALLKFKSSIVSLSASRKASKKIRSVYVEEEEFTIEGDFMKVEPLKEELKAFIKCVKNNDDFIITPLQALNNLRICEDIRRLNGIL